MIERAKLIKHCHRAGYADDPRVNLVGHSMGGLIIVGHLQRLIVRHFTGRADRRGSTWGRPAPGVLPDQWMPPIPDLRNRQQ